MHPLRASRSMPVAPPLPSPRAHAAPWHVRRPPSWQVSRPPSLSPMQLHGLLPPAPSTPLSPTPSFPSLSPPASPSWLLAPAAASLEWESPPEAIISLESTRTWPASAARCHAVLPCASGTSGPAPSTSSLWQRPSAPPRAAKCRGVCWPEAVGCSGLAAWRCTSSSTMSQLPPCAALCSTLVPAASWAVGSPPCCEHHVYKGRTIACTVCRI